ncbi:unnamed protein product [Caenorhabditis bovis]|uniref:Nose resistant-to-fluoxetine protein N-terminal domain-containing protein n=1 Tax=Caenorhabditis bovis TaxID=2654633 RepID=A0A8S1EH81_9PELO|nr:unnamed protein product [Caenorhabditis bovis]
MIFLLFLVAICSASNFQQNPFTQFDSSKNAAISGQCANDTRKWIASLRMFMTAAEHCTITLNCTNDDRRAMRENRYAFQQLDAFGKFPVPGLAELTNVLDGSYQECQRIDGIAYETNYCYLMLFPGKDLVRLFNDHSRLPFKACAAFCVKRDVEKDSAFWGFTIFMIVAVGVALVATVIDFLRETILGIESAREKMLGLRILYAFSFWTNAGQILSVKEQKAGFIKSLDCIRLFSMSWVVFGHATYYFTFSDTLAPISTVRNKIYNHLVLDAFLSVDTFFMLSGIVVAYLFFKQRPKPAIVRSPLTWTLFYVHRYLRLTPPVMLFIGFYTVYMPFLKGPYMASFGNEYAAEVDNCKQRWWQNLIYINNFGPEMKSCYGITWYLAADTQMYVAAPIVLIAFYYKSIVGLATATVIGIASIVATYVIYATHSYLPAESIGNDPHGNYFNLIYGKPWIRCTPYLVGIVTGYFLAINGARKPRLHLMLILIGWALALAVGLACVLSNYDYDRGVVWSAFGKATFNNFQRLGWSLALAWTIIANHLGWGGPINAFMSHPIWQPFGRLSYCAYIVHWVVIGYYMNVGERPIHFFNIWQVYLYYAIPITFLSFFFAFWWSGLFELSTLKLEKMLIEAIIGRQPSAPKIEDVRKTASWDVPQNCA